jgi:hypothetical protein
METTVTIMPKRDGQLYLKDLRLLEVGDKLVLNRLSARGKHRTEVVRFEKLHRKRLNTRLVWFLTVKGGAEYSTCDMECIAYAAGKVWNARNWLTRS